MDMSSCFPSDVMNQFNTPFLFVTSHNLDKNAKAIEPDIINYGPIEPKLQYLYIFTAITPLRFIIDTSVKAAPVFVKHQSPTHRILAETPHHILYLHAFSLDLQPGTPKVRIGMSCPGFWCLQNCVFSNLKPHTT